MAFWLLPSETGHGSAVLFSCWCSDGQGIIAESDLLLFERDINYVDSSTLLGQPNMAQNWLRRLCWGRIRIILPLILVVNCGGRPPAVIAGVYPNSMKGFSVRSLKKRASLFLNLFFQTHLYAYLDLNKLPFNTTDRLSNFDESPSLCGSTETLSR